MSPNFVMRCRPRTCGWCVSLVFVHQQMASNSQHTLLLSLPCKKAQAVSPTYAQSKAQMDRISSEFHDYWWWLFRTLHILHHNTRPADERRKKEEDEQFSVTWFNKLFYVLFDGSICSLAIIAVLTVIHWLKPPSCCRAIPTYGLCYCEPIMNIAS